MKLPILRAWPQQLTPYLLLLPGLAVLVPVVFGPPWQVLALSFTRYDALSPPVWIGLAHFQTLAQDAAFGRAIGQTLFLAILVVPVLVVAPLLLAILANRPRTGWFRTVCYFPALVSVAIAGVTWKWIYAENGLLNGWLPTPIPWLTEPGTATVAIAVTVIWRGLGYYAAIYLAGLQTIPADLYDAAALDGSDGWQKHWDITIPLMRPYIFLVLVLTTVAALKIFEEPYLMTRGGPANRTQTVVYYLVEQGFQRLNFGYAAAIGTVLFVATFGISLLALQLQRIAPSARR
ncbi:MAG TPA: lactose ABC transporter permease [Cyanobacteria bacterium UBA8156]|jgi:putative chitobiose transport system permease protein|nr:lactose ABC transporter permease [Cyanobacteria bacterium UBA8156]